MATVTYKVVKGDTLSEIAAKYNTTVTKLAKINNIKNVNLIYVGQVLTISKTNSSGQDDDSPVVDTTNVSTKATIVHFGLQSAGADRTVFATWSWDRSNTEKYETEWYYYVNGIWFKGSDSTTEDKESVYSASAVAEKVRFRVKPISKTRTVNKKETVYWTAEWSSYKTYSFADNPPSTPSSAPNVELEDFKLTATLDNLDVNGTHIQFQVVKDDSKVYATGKAKISTGSVSYSVKVAAGGKYKVRCRAVRGEEYSEWTDYSQNYSTPPLAPSKIKTCKATSETSIYLEWPAVTTATSYDIEYATKKEYFDGSSETTPINNIEGTHYELTGLTTGQEYFFRVRAVNDAGESGWTGIKSIIIGITPIAPTTWSSTTTGIVGENVTLYWVHNTEDGSTQRYAQVELDINGVVTTNTINTVDEEDDEKTMHYIISTSGYTEGTKILWRVRTAGVTKVYGDWSIQRTIDIYATPTLSLVVTNSSGEAFDTLTSFPIKMEGVAGPNTQTAIGYHVSISAVESYETVDNMGNEVYVSAGAEVYSKYTDASGDLALTISAGDVRLENNASYILNVIVSMNSGLTANASSEFSVSWDDTPYAPTAEISIDPETLTAHVRPYCEDQYGVLMENVTLSLYRREYDGGFTEIASGLSNVSETFVTDPHPALDYARYRVVAIDESTGAVSFADTPGYPVGEPAIIMQWDEKWTNFEVSNEDEMVEPTWSGSMLKLPYNIDVSDSYGPDVSAVNYIGRQHPVAYYGTQRGETSTWNTEIPKYDKETLYAIRRLAVWMGNVYVREPSGSGYWANVNVSFSQKHLDVTIPITFQITRVEGGA